MNKTTAPLAYSGKDDYEIRVRYSAAHEAFIAHVAEMPGIVLEGRTAEAAVSEVRFVLGRIIETYARDNDPLPAPGDIPEEESEALVPHAKRPAAKNLLASAFGRMGGLSKSPRKAASSRRNGALGAKYGKLGGRPKGSTKKQPAKAATQ